MSPLQFSLRPAGLPGDDSFITSVFDSSIPYLKSIGSGAQWGSVPFSERPGWIEETQRQIRDSQRSQIEDQETQHGADALRILILEVEAQHVNEAISSRHAGVHARVEQAGKCYVAVGFAFVRENWLPSYLPDAVVSRAGLLAREQGLYVEVMVTDVRTKSLCPGAGAALLRELREYGRARGKKAVYLDGWAGNGGRLIRYYEKQGLEVVAEFSLVRANKEPWIGSLMQLTTHVPEEVMKTFSE
ncbi:hypothetical protein E8E12_011550 [Didymella heteroderae]|uniref:N-acetyltransferase domain-containing protein n=1 Tax=Didymella heteroderae TaxID=1769908 RepID=A0A9P4X0J3_9PLEO|nr:hypothetical protein E8E12_011550 [Didymella heteroderae]